MNLSGLPLDLAIIVPTFNERDNIRPLLELLARALEGVRYEVIFVDDDSTDGTLDALQAIASVDARVRYLHRIGRRGLSSAVVEGLQATSAPFMAVMDADLQHDETLLPRMLALLRRGEADIVVGSRYVAGGGVGDWDKRRTGLSLLATRIARLVVKAELTDPMSGYFMLTRQAFAASVRGLSSQGFKILLDIFASHPGGLRLVELPYVFRVRQHGSSKLDAVVAWDYAMLLLDKLVGHLVPVRFIAFMFVGGLGVIVHFATLALLYKGAAIAFPIAQTGATGVAMTFNFFLNNLLTYRDKRLTGFWGIGRGLLTFYALCGLGATANIGVATVVFEHHTSWWLSAMAGILVGVVWNYAMSSLFTWRAR